MRGKNIIFTLIIFGLLFVNTMSINLSSSATKITTNSEIDLDNSYSSWYWDSIKLISVASNDDSWHPSIYYDSNNNVHFAWTDTDDTLLGSGIDTDVFYRKWHGDLLTWGALELVSSESAGVSQDPDIVVSDDGTVHVAWWDSSDYDSAGTDYDIFYKQRDSAGTWSTTEVITTASTMESRHPLLGIDNQNDVYLAWSDSEPMLSSGLGYDVFYQILDSDTSTWGSMDLVTTTSIGYAHIRGLCVYEQTVHFAWDDQTNDLLGSGADSDVFYRSLESSTLSSIALISSESDKSSYAPSIACDNEGNPHIVWSDSVDLDPELDSDIYYKYYDPHLGIWTPIELISTVSTALSTESEIRISSNGAVHVMWTDSTDYAGAGLDADIFYRYKDPETNLWSTTAVATPECDISSWNADFVIDDYGHLFVTWSGASPVAYSGTDTDILYRKFVGAPDDVSLTILSTEAEVDEDFQLSWSSSQGAKEYLLYRENSSISSVAGLDSHVEPTIPSFSDRLTAPGNYYYVVVASNDYGDSELSNVVQITINEKQQLFVDINWGEIIILGGFLGALQIVFAIVIVATKSASKPSSSSKKGKKK
ncbi:MAG: hypothetical protein ACTSVO_09265 [Candidatus Heimdallarchaeaceae archaeon]